MGILISKNWLNRFFIISFISIFCCVVNIYASTSGSMPFNTQISNFESNFISFVFVASVILFLVTCVLLAFDHDMTGNMKKIINIFFWLSLGGSGVTGVTLLFGGGAIF